MTSAAIAMPFSRVVGAYFTEVRFEIIRLLRIPAFIAPMLILPLAFYLLLGVGMADMRHNSASGVAMDDATVFVSFAVYGVMGPGFFGIGSLLATERSNGITILKRALPLPPAAFIIAKIVMALAFGVTIVSMLLVLAETLGGVRLPPDRLVTLAGIMVLGVAPSCAIGLFIATAFPPMGANAVSNIAFIAMVMLGGLFYPLPGVLDAMRPIWPAFHMQQLGLWAVGGKSIGDPAVHLAVLLAVTIAFSSLATWRLTSMK